MEIPECCFQYNYFQYDASVCSNADSSLCHVVQYWNYQQLIASDYSLLVRRSILHFSVKAVLPSIPFDLDESARIDGAGHLRICMSSIIPISRPVLVVVALFAFLNTWNDFLGPLVYLNSEEKYTLSVGLQLFIGTYKAEWNLMMAAACVVVMPCIIVFLIGQRYFIEGITMSGIKG